MTRSVDLIYVMFTCTGHKSDTYDEKQLTRRGAKSLLFTHICFGVTLGVSHFTKDPVLPQFVTCASECSYVCSPNRRYNNFGCRLGAMPVHSMSSQCILTCASECSYVCSPNRRYNNFGCRLGAMPVHSMSSQCILLW